MALTVRLLLNQFSFEIRIFFIIFLPIPQVILICPLLLAHSFGFQLSSNHFYDYCAWLYCLCEFPWTCVSVEELLLLWLRVFWQFCERVGSMKC